MLVEHRCSDFDMDQQQHVPGDGVVVGYGTINGRLVFVFQPGFHRIWGCAVRGARGKNLQDHGSGDESGCARHWP